ncbi:hypothetical protein JCM21900_000492 [Sporobolomyces salmonicolor]
MADPVHYVELVPHYNGVYVFLAWLVSVVGAWTTLEILLRRTGNSGAWNAMLLLGAGITFGSTATFGMHFVGNQAVTLRFRPPWEGRGIPLSYNAGYTVLSLVVSCLSMILAFSFIGLRFSPSNWRLRDEEQGSGCGSEKDVGEDDPVDVEFPEMDRHVDFDSKDQEGGFSGDFKGAPFDVNLKPPPTGQSDKTTMSRLSFNSCKLTIPVMPALPLSLAKRGGKAAGKHRVDGEDEDDSDDGGDFGMHSATVSKGGVAKILGAGIICGGGIAAMHYVGQVSISSVPRITNTWYTIFLSILIAMTAVSVGLYMLFVHFRPKLQHSWYKRLGVAMILGVGVTLMHFVALLGTHYWAIEGHDISRAASDARAKRLIIAVICVVAPVCCILLLIFAYVAQQRLVRQRAARHRIILATAIFDQQGLLLVHPESGLLPSARIYPSSSPEEKLSSLGFFGFRRRLHLEASKLKLARSDPAFIAFLKLSWSWRTRRRSAQASADANREERDSAQASGSRSGDGDEGDHERSRLSETDDAMTDSQTELMRRSILSFEMASEEIAMQLIGGSDVKTLGVLYDGILKTGHFQVSSKTSGDRFTVTQGQMLVLARRLKSTTERAALIARGFVFAEPGAVARVTSQAYAAPNDRVFDYFRDVYRFTKFGVVKRLDRGRLYGGVLLQAIPGEGLHIVVDEKQHHSLPMIELASLVSPAADRSKLPSSTLPNITIQSVVQGLQQLTGQSLLDLTNVNFTPSALDSAPQLRSIIANMLRPYLDRIISRDTMSFLLPRLLIEPSIVPLTARPGPTYGLDGLVKDSYLLCLKAVIPSSIILPGQALNWLPFSLYQAQSENVTLVSGPTRGGRPGTGGSVASRPGTGASRPGTGASRPGTGVSVVSAWEGRISRPGTGVSRPGTGVSISSAWEGRTDHRKGSAIFDKYDEDCPFPTSTAAPSASPAFASAPVSSDLQAPSSSGPYLTSIPPQTAVQRASVHSQVSTNQDSEALAGPSSPPPAGGSLPVGVPEYTPDWIIPLVRSTVAQSGRATWNWEVPHRMNAGRNSD